MHPTPLLLLSGILLAATLTARASPNPRPKLSILIHIDESPLITPASVVFDCSDKDDGNYADPGNCTRFISCSDGIASFRDCPMCQLAPVTCPSGSTVYNETVESVYFLFLLPDLFHTLFTMKNSSEWYKKSIFFCYEWFTSPFQILVYYL